MDWENLRYVLVVAETKSIVSAARELGVNRTTVLRRINAFEKQLGCRLFDRSHAGYAMTLEAEELLGAARGLEQSLVDLERRIAGRELRLEGEIRVTTTDSLLLSMVGAHLVTFGQKHPHITVEVSVTNHHLNLTKRDADVAIRPTSKPPENLVGRRLLDIDFAVYAAPAYKRALIKAGSTEYRWLGLDEPLSTAPIGEWVRSHVDAEQICFRADSFLALKMAAEHGLGVTVLPRVVGDASVQLERLDEIEVDVCTGLWILTHPDLIRSARIHALIEHFTEAVRDKPS